MGWNWRYILRSYTRSSLWFIPLLSYIAALILIRAFNWLDEWSGWSWDWVMEVPVAQTSLEGVVAATLSFIVFAFSSLLVAIQVSSAQLTPRIIATTILRDNTLKAIVTLFVLTLAFATGTLSRTQERVPYVLLTVTFILGGGSVAAFLYLIDYAARLLRPITVVRKVGEEGLRVIEQVYPGKIKGVHRPIPPTPSPGEPARTLHHRGQSAIILAVDLDGLVREARRTGGVIEFAHQVGNFVAVGEPMMHLHGGAAAADDRVLRQAVAMGSERTIEQDVTFAMRIIVDIALKALSTAINDPTTAVLAIDQVHRLLRAIGRRHLHDDALRDPEGRVCVIFRTADWNDFVHLACREIRLCGVGTLQVARRLRAMLENLLAVLPEARAPALREELDLLDRALNRLDLMPEDLALARLPDLQGLGAPRRG
jgi:uncharacterized membrane protein